MKKFFVSLSLKLIVLVIMWLIIAVSLTGLSLYLSKELKNSGIVINDAGSLRKRVYHVAALASQPSQKNVILTEKENFNKTLNRIEELYLQNWLASNKEAQRERVEQIRKISGQIFGELSSLAANQLSIEQLNTIDQLVELIDQLVKNIELDNVRNIQLLQTFQFFLVVGMILSAFIAVFFLNRLVIRPLNILKSGIQKISHGDLSVFIDAKSSDEFGEVAKGFNQMVQNLNDLYQNLEFKVKEKTLALEEKNHELQLLYQVTSCLNESQTLENTVNGFLNTVMRVFGADAGSIRLLKKTTNELETICSSGLTGRFLISDNQKAKASIHKGIHDYQPNIMIRHLRNSKIHKNDPNKKYFDHCICFYIRNKSQTIGVLSLYFIGVEILDERQMRSVETLTNQLGVAIENQRWALMEKQFAVIEERNLMAQGLHDSIAQTLSFLNIQVQMLENALERRAEVQVLENLSYIKEGLKESYEDVRELLLNFRTRVNEESFYYALESVIERFERQTHIHVSLTITGDGSEPHMEQQLQVIFILQEALSNIRKHAQAKNVLITIDSRMDRFIMRISDDGAGFDAEQIKAKQDSHVGIGIMRERAARANGEINIVSNEGKGTDIVLQLVVDKRKSS